MAKLPLGQERLLSEGHKNKGEVVGGKGAIMTLACPERYHECKGASFNWKRLGAYIGPTQRPKHKQKIKSTNTFSKKKPRAKLKEFRCRLR